MTLKSDAKFKGKLTCGVKYDLEEFGGYFGNFGHEESSIHPLESLKILLQWTLFELKKIKKSYLP